MPTITRDGVELAYEDQGAGEPSFVFVHGWTCDRSFFAPQAAHFAQRHRVVSIDLRGHGQSDKPQGPYPIMAYAEDLAFMIERLNLGKVVAVGHSMGGIAVMQLAAAFPQQVSAIVMVDPTPLVRPPEARMVNESMLAALEAGDQGPRRRFVENMFLPTSDLRLIEQVCTVMLNTPDHVAIGAMRGSLEFDALKVAAQCRVPVLHVAATPPRNPLHLMSQWLPSSVNGATVGAGHFNQLEVPEQVNSMIEGFLRHYVAGT